MEAEDVERAPGPIKEFEEVHHIGKSGSVDPVAEFIANLEIDTRCTRYK